MAVSDPATDVPTPTGTLQGVAAFRWDGAAWQPAGRAGPSVATPTGVLRGVAAFNGTPWQPSGMAQPGVATPTGTLDGVAVYTWSGAAWTPPGGQPTPSTPSGALRGVASFNWDGAAWQPAAQAGPSVATPYGVLDGVAMFGWTGSAWAAVGAPSLSLDFMRPGTLDPRITFTRASTATYFNSAGVVQTAAVNAPRWDYNPGTLALNGLLIEEARTNIALQSTVFGGWAPSSAVVAVPVATQNSTIAPDGTLTGTRLVYPSVIGTNATSVWYQAITLTAASYTYSVYLKGAVGGEQIYLCVNPTRLSAPRITLTTQWQRFSLVFTGTAAGWAFEIGTDLQDATQASTPAQTIFAWGAQVEAGAFPTSHIPTTAAAVTRAADVCTMPTGTWFNSAAGSASVDYMVAQSPNPGTINRGALCFSDGTNANRIVLFGQVNASANARLAQIVAGTSVTVNVSPVVADMNKLCGAWDGTTGYCVLNAGAVSTLVQSTPPGLNLVVIGNITDPSTQCLYGHVRRVQYWPRVLSNAEMQSVTT